MTLSYFYNGLHIYPDWKAEKIRRLISENVAPYVDNNEHEAREAGFNSAQEYEAALAEAASEVWS